MPNAPCISPGIWLIPRTLEITPDFTLYVQGNVTVSGNLTVSPDSTLKIQSGAVIQVSGCVSLQGRLELDATNVSRASNTIIVPIIVLSDQNGGVCGNSSSTTMGMTTFSSINVTSGLNPCEIASATAQLNYRTLSVALTFGEDESCKQSPSSPTSTGAGGLDTRTIAIIAGSTAAGFVVITIIVIILVIKLRFYLVPTYKAELKMRRFQKEQGKKG